MFKECSAFLNRFSDFFECAKLFAEFKQRLVFIIFEPLNACRNVLKKLWQYSGINEGDPDSTVAELALEQVAPTLEVVARALEREELVVGLLKLGLCVLELLALFRGERIRRGLPADRRGRRL